MKKSEKVSAKDSLQPGCSFSSNIFEDSYFKITFRDVFIAKQSSSLIRRRGPIGFGL